MSGAEAQSGVHDEAERPKAVCPCPQSFTHSQPASYTFSQIVQVQEDLMSLTERVEIYLDCPPGLRDIRDGSALLAEVEHLINHTNDLYLRFRINHARHISPISTSSGMTSQRKATS